MSESEGYPLGAYERVLAASRGESTGSACLDAVLAVAFDVHRDDVRSGSAERAEVQMRAAVMSDDAARVSDLRDIEHARILDRLEFWGIDSRKS
jgi:hypothetical protein